jgi:signal peptidase II
MTLPRHRTLAVGVLLVIAADWISKFWVQNRLVLGGAHPLVDGWVWLTHHHNTGVAFSLLANANPSWRMPVLVLAALLGIAACVRILLDSGDYGVRAAAALVIAGAAGNLGDRLMNGGVTDFILVRFFPFVFNVADVAITCGAVLLAVRLFWEPPDQDANDSPTPTPAET